MSWGKQGASHNYSFTSELRYWFTYDAASSPTLEFTGDDDLWVFVNGKLALDLGGLHSQRDGSFTLDPATAAQLGLQNKRLYEIALFHAERHTDGSNFKLTLRDFVKKRSVCTEVCGDGIRTRSEQCDNGAANTDPLGAPYGSCTTQCKLGPYCGDGITQSSQEECDDGINLSSWAVSLQSGTCGPGCKTPAYCGDGIVQAAYEQCDRGAANNVGGYGGCTAECKYGPRCGDGKVTDGEQCDNGYNVTTYVKHLAPTDCAPGCKKPHYCGDGTVDYPFEVCDRGAANTDDGSYNSCTTECTLGPHCGDGVVQPEEVCDGVGCSSDCRSWGPN